MKGNPLQPSNPLEDIGLEDEAEEVLEYLDGLGPHPTFSHKLHGEEVETPGASYEEILDNTGVGVDPLIEVLNVLERRGEVYRTEPEDRDSSVYHITSPSERLPEPDGIHGDITVVRFEAGKD